MSLQDLATRKWRATAFASAFALLSSTIPMSPVTAAAAEHSSTQTPIQHVIVIIGENRTFDHVFATYQPKQGETVDNLLSKGIVKADGTQGPNFALSNQYSAIDGTGDSYQVSPGGKTLYPILPTPLAGGPTTPYFQTLGQGLQAENGLALSYYIYLLTGGTGLQPGQPDTRIKNVFNLPPGPFQLTNSSTHPYDAYDNSPVHRFYRLCTTICNRYAFYAAFWKATNSVLVAAKRCALSSR